MIFTRSSISNKVVISVFQASVCLLINVSIDVRDAVAGEGGGGAGGQIKSLNINCLYPSLTLSSIPLA